MFQLEKEKVQDNLNIWKDDKIVNTNDRDLPANSFQMNNGTRQGLEWTIILCMVIMLALHIVDVIIITKDVETLFVPFGKILNLNEVCMLMM